MSERSDFGRAGLTFLLEGEEILWQASPNWDEAARPVHPFLRCFWLIGLGILFFFFTVVFVHWGRGVGEYVFYRSVHSVGLVVIWSLFIAYWVWVIGKLFKYFLVGSARTDGSYYLTDRRLVIVSSDGKELRSVTRANVLFQARLAPNGFAQDLSLWLGEREDDGDWDYIEPVVLRALSDGETAQKKMMSFFPLDRDVTSAGGPAATANFTS